MTIEFKQQLIARHGLLGVRLAETLTALDGIAEIARVLCAADLEMDDDGRPALNPTTVAGLHGAVERLADSTAAVLRDTIEAEARFSRPPAPWSAWQRDQDDRLLRDLVGELQDASTIICNVLNLLTPAQKLQWAEANDRDGCSGEGTTRANEREAVLARVRELQS